MKKVLLPLFVAASVFAFGVTQAAEVAAPPTDKPAAEATKHTTKKKLHKKAHAAPAKKAEEAKAPGQ